MYTDFKEEKTKLDETILFFQNETKRIKTGRANPSLVEDLPVDYFGAKTPLKQVASVSTQDAKTILITPWNVDSLVNIEKAISESDLGVSPNNDGQVIRLSFPPLTEERRTEFVKILGKKTEEARIKVRQIRENAWDQVQKAEKSGEISEDDKFKAKENLQKMVDEYNSRIEALSEKKEVEITAV